MRRHALRNSDCWWRACRDDYPEKDEKFSTLNTIIRKTTDGTMDVQLAPLPEMPDYLKQIIEEMK